MLIDIGEIIYETRFQHAQLEVTGKCNMACKHCRAWEEARVDLPLKTIETVVEFVMTEADDDFRMTISGGEPFLRKDLPDIVALAVSRGVEDIIITTNGSLVNIDSLKPLSDLGLRNLCIQVSIDSPNPEEHDTFRLHRGAFDKAVTALDLASSVGLVASLRATLTADRISQIDGLIALAVEHGATRVGIGSVIPVGRGKENELGMRPEEKKRFLETLTRAKLANPEVDVTTEDPLKFALGTTAWDFGDDIDLDDEGVFGGCTAGVSGFNVTSDGFLTPCAVFLEPITNAIGKNAATLQKEYASADIIKDLLKRNLDGKCGSCRLKRVCGGCRAVAHGVHGNYLASDATCWR